MITINFNIPSLNIDNVRIYIVMMIFIIFIPAIFLGNEIEQDISTQEELIELNEVIIKPHKIKYSKKGNPGYELWQIIRDNITKSDPFNNNFYSYNFHQKITLAVNDKDTASIKYKDFQFLKNYADTAVFTSKPIIVVSTKEKIGYRDYNKQLKKDNKIITYNYNRGIDDAFNQENVNKILEDKFREINIFQNDINLLGLRFVSPLSRIAGSFYHFYIGDTISIENDSKKYIELSFAPANDHSLGFNGYFLVADDSTHFIKSVEMRVPRNINLNFVDKLFIRQEFELDTINNRHKLIDDLSAEMKLFPFAPAFYVRRTIAQNDFSYEPYSIAQNNFDIKSTVGQDIKSNQQNYNNFLNPFRLLTLSYSEEQVGQLYSEVKKIKWYGPLEKLFQVLTEGYISLSYKDKPSKVDIGPFGNFISYNSLEGVRLKVGAMTMPYLNNHLFAKTYVAYGFRDHKWKYMAKILYSFNQKKYYPEEYPIHSISAMYKYDVDMLGQHYLFGNVDELFLSFKRKESDLATYKRLSEIQYSTEVIKNFSISLGFNYQIQYSSQFLPFINGYGQKFFKYPLSSIFVKLRYAPNENFIDSRENRILLNKEIPVVQFIYEYGPRGLFGSPFSIHVTEFSCEKRFWFSAFGYLDALFKMGKIWSKVQYPSLLWPATNLSYTIQPGSYSLMNPMEFANDWYCALDLTYWMNGLLLNRIPLINGANIREVLGFKLLMGGLSAKNNPEKDDSLYRFPFDSDTNILSHIPYMELSVGLDNILSFLRLDYVWRLTYRNLPNIDTHGIRFSIHFNF